MENRFFPEPSKDSLFSDCFLALDATECPLDRPTKREDRNLYSNGRHKENSRSRYNLKYTVAVQLITGKICFVSGTTMFECCSELIKSYYNIIELTLIISKNFWWQFSSSDPEPGSVPDITALRNTNIGDYLKKDEHLLADKGYQGSDLCFSPYKGMNDVYQSKELIRKLVNNDSLSSLNICSNVLLGHPHQLPPSELAINDVISSTRQIVECVFSRMKIFRVLNHRYVNWKVNNCIKITTRDLLIEMEVCNWKAQNYFYCCCQYHQYCIRKIPFVSTKELLFIKVLVKLMWLFKCELYLKWSLINALSHLTIGRFENVNHWTEWILDYHFKTRFKTCFSQLHVTPNSNPPPV